MSAMRKDQPTRKFTFDLDLGDTDAVARSYDALPANGPAHAAEAAMVSPFVDAEAEAARAAEEAAEAEAQARAEAEAAARAEAEAQAAAEPEPEPEPEPPAPTFSEADLEAARDEAYVAGHTAALQEAEAATERLASESLHFIAQAMRKMVGSIDAPYERLNAMAVEIAVAIVRRVAPVITARHGTEEVEALVRQIIPTVIDQPRLVVRVHPALAAQVRAAIRPVVEDVNFEGRITVLDDRQIQPGDARVEWGDGGVERDTPRTWREILAIIDEYVTTDSGITGDFAAAEAEADAARPRRSGRNGDAGTGAEATGGPEATAEAGAAPDDAGRTDDANDDAAGARRDGTEG